MLQYSADEGLFGKGTTQCNATGFRPTDIVWLKTFHRNYTELDFGRSIGLSLALIIVAPEGVHVPCAHASPQVVQQALGRQFLLG